jgi:hypothetical protein
MYYSAAKGANVLVVGLINLDHRTAGRFSQSARRDGPLRWKRGWGNQDSDADMEVRPGELPMHQSYIRHQPV